MQGISDSEEEAVRWAVRASDADFGDWEGLLAWIGDDPERNRAYNLAMASVNDVATMLSEHEGAIVVPLPVRTLPPRAMSRRWMAGGGMALAASLACLLVPGRSPEPPTQRIFETSPGQRRTLALGDGSRIDLAGGSRMLIDPARPRVARLERGRAVFTVRHDPSAPFEVVAGGHRIVDVGTVFEVDSRGGAASVAVAEGEVMVDPAAKSLVLTAGDAVRLAADGTATRSRVTPESVGHWRQERLRYRNATLAQVADDLSTVLGHPVTVDPALRAHRFDGTITPASLRGQPDQAAALLDIRIRAGPKGWELQPR